LTNKSEFKIICSAKSELFTANPYKFKPWEDEASKSPFYGVRTINVGFVLKLEKFEAAKFWLE